MTTEQMRFFMEAARLLNFTVAAENLYTTQPTLSRQIMNMEKELDVQLFSRRNNTVVLTAAGMELYAGIRTIYDNYTTLADRVRNVGKGISGVLRIGLMEDQTLNATLADAICRFRQLNSNVSIQVSRLTINSIRQQLNEGTLDIGDVMKTPNAEFDLMTVISSTMEVAQFACSQALLESVPTLMTKAMCIRMLEKNPLLLPSRRNFGEAEDDLPVERWMDSVNIKLHELSPKVLFVEDICDLPLHVAAGLGVTIVNETHLLSMDPRVMLIPMAEHHPYCRVQVFHPNNKNPLLAPFLTLFRQLLAENQTT